MNDTARDHPNVIVFAPVIPITTLAIACGLQWLIPLGFIAGIDQTWRLAFGTIAAIAGALVTINGGVALVRRGTNVSPTRPTTALATEGIFGWTRNPLYVGVAPIMIGIALIFALFFALNWLLLLMVPSYFILHFAVVMREEQYLESKFGDAYRSYKAGVARYVWPI